MVRRTIDLATDVCHYVRCNLLKTVEEGTFPKSLLETLNAIDRDTSELKGITTLEDQKLAARLLRQRIELLIADLKDAELALKRKHTEAQHHVLALTALLHHESSR